jgi:alkylation response protein AidB-like acyl-CoA dehydrogenase
VTDTASRILADVRELAPSIAARAAEIEAARRVPLDMVETLRSIGVFRMFAPRSHGGLELALPESLAIPDGARRRRWIGRLGGDDRQRVGGLPGDAAARDL